MTHWRRAGGGGGGVGVLTDDVEGEVHPRARCCQEEAHDDEDGGVGGDAHQHPGHHRQGEGGQQGLGPAQPEDRRRRESIQASSCSVCVRGCVLPVSCIAQAEAAGQDAQDETHLLHWDHPVVVAHQVPLEEEQMHQAGRVKVGRT